MLILCAFAFVPSWLKRVALTAFRGGWYADVGQRPAWWA